MKSRTAGNDTELKVKRVIGVKRIDGVNEKVDVFVGIEVAGVDDIGLFEGVFFKQGFVRSIDWFETSVNRFVGNKDLG